MPIFQIQEQRLLSISQSNFHREKELQSLIEKNLRSVFNCRFVATEFSTGVVHAGRIDTLALSEDHNPVIIEYKKVESSELINQSLYYLHWLRDHQGDFEVAVHKALGVNAQIDWSDIRVICIAPNFKKYDLLAVQVMGANIELWKYRLFENATLHLEEVFQKSITTMQGMSDGAKNPVMVAAGKKAALARKTGVYTFEGHLKGKSLRIRDLVLSVQEFVMNLDPAMEEVPKKHYVAYKISQNIVCVEVRTQRLLLFLKVDPKSVTPLPKHVRDVSDIGHSGTGDLEISIANEDELEAARPYIERAYHRVGG